MTMTDRLAQFRRKLVSFPHLFKRPHDDLIAEMAVALELRFVEELVRGGLVGKIAVGAPVVHDVGWQVPGEG